MKRSATNGGKAEQSAASYLVGQGHSIICRNWRTRTAEIDIVSCLDDHVYFFEVKYRATDKYGAGLEYITPRKLEHMRAAAEQWIALHNTHNATYSLAMIEVSGLAFAITDVRYDIS